MSVSTTNFVESVLDNEKINKNNKNININNNKKKKDAALVK